MAVHAGHHTKGQGKGKAPAGREEVPKCIHSVRCFGVTAHTAFATRRTVAFQNAIATHYTPRALIKPIVSYGISRPPRSHQTVRPLPPCSCFPLARPRARRVSRSRRARALDLRYAVCRSCLAISLPRRQPLQFCDKGGTMLSRHFMATGAAMARRFSPPTSAIVVSAGIALFVFQVKIASQSAFVAHDPGVRGGPAGAGEPLPGLSPQELDYFNVGKEEFEEAEEIAEGIGPRMNLDSCG